MLAPALNGLEHLNDLAVLVLFSAFEAIIRGNILEQLGREPAPSHPVISRAMVAAHERVAEGSFFAVLQSYKGIDDPLMEEVNQVRRYRNWVAHGRRSERPEVVTPEAAYSRLGRFLTTFFPPPILTEAEWLDMLRENGDRG